MRTLRFNAKDILSGHLMLVNPAHPMQSELSRSQLAALKPDSADILLENQTAKMLSEVTERLNCAQAIVPVSGYRTTHEQQKLYADTLREHGVEFTQKYVALPGCS